MKNKPDDYYNDGLFEIARFGTNIVQRNIMSPAIHKQLMENLVESCPRVKSQIDQLVIKISGEVLMCNPLQLLSFAQLHSLSNMIGITSESQQMGMEYVSAQRMVEYIQSIYGVFLLLSQQLSKVISSEHQYNQSASVDCLVSENVLPIVNLPIHMFQNLFEMHEPAHWIIPLIVLV